MKSPSDLTIRASEPDAANLIESRSRHSLILFPIKSRKQYFYTEGRSTYVHRRRIARRNNRRSPTGYLATAITIATVRGHCYRYRCRPQFGARGFSDIDTIKAVTIKPLETM